MQGPGGVDEHLATAICRSGRIRRESHWVTDTEPGGPPPRSTATTLTDPTPVEIILWKSVEVHDLGCKVVFLRPDRRAFSMAPWWRAAFSANK
jgi:hypothetical protein